MRIKSNSFYVVLAVVLGIGAAVKAANERQSNVNEQTETINALQQWLKQPRETRAALADQDFADKALSRNEADQSRELLWEDYLAFLRQEREAEWQAKEIKLGDHTMRFDYRTFGEMPKDGRNFYISMHGGGGTRAEVNEQQWRNQVRLYQPQEGIYLAPRAPPTLGIYGINLISTISLTA